MLNAITGWESGPNELLAAGDRSVNLKQAVSNKLGVTREHDKLPRICSAPLDEGSTAGVEPDREEMLRGYYRFRGWDRDTGRSTRQNSWDWNSTRRPQRCTLEMEPFHPQSTFVTMKYFVDGAFREV
jgi:aldehyde:ferredoxin oxidoreductase